MPYVMHFATMLLFLAPIHSPIASAYLGGFDYNATHFIRGLNDGGLLNTLFWWVTFTGSITFMVLITIALYLAGARKEALVFALVFILANVVAFGLKYAIARPRPSDLGVPQKPSPRFQVLTPRTPLPSRRRFRLITESSVSCCSRGPCLSPSAESTSASTTLPTSLGGRSSASS